MFLWMRDRENFEKGRLEGKAEAKKLFAEILLQKGTLSDAEIAEIVDIPLEDFKQLKATLLTCK